MSTEQVTDVIVRNEINVPEEYLPAVATPSAPTIGGMTVEFSDAEIEEAKRRMQAQVAAVSARLTSNTMDHVKFKGNAGFILADGSLVPKLRVVIVAFTNVNTLYATGYTPGKVEAPICYAISPYPQSLAPRANAPQPQAENCETCPKNQFKSAPNGKGKACRNARKLAVIIYKDNAPVQSGQLVTIDVPPTSLKAFDRYVSGLAAQYQCLPVAVVTELTLSPENTYAQLNFAVAKPLSSSEIVAAYRLEPQLAARLDTDIDLASFG